MNRRKFLIGAGSLAAGSAAAMGTGAFSTVEADRTVSVNVASDSQALLALDKAENENSAYAKEQSTGAITVDISDSNNSGFDGKDPNGVNPNATTRIFDIFTIQNQGTQPAAVWVPPESVSSSTGDDVTDGTGFYIDPQATDRPNGSYSGTQYDGATSSNGEISLTGIYDGPQTYIDNISGAEWNDFTLNTGQSFDFGVWINSDDNSFSGDISMTLKAAAVDSVGNQPDTL